MKPVPQSKRHDRGDCIRACIASILELPIEEVIDVSELADSGLTENGWPKWWVKLQEWCQHRGFFFLEMKLEANIPFMPLPFPAWAIFLGLNKFGNKHAVVGLCQNKPGEGDFHLVHDPFHHGGGIQTVESVCFLVPIDPALCKERMQDNAIASSIIQAGAPKPKRLILPGE